MPDPTDLATLATHGGTAILGAGGVGAFMRWIQGREAQEVATKLALMGQKLDQLVAAASKHESIGERVALLEQSARGLTDRLDALVSPVPSKERRRR